MLLGAFCLVIDHMACNIRWPITLFISGVYNAMEAALKKKSKLWIFSSSSLEIKMGFYAQIYSLNL
jgi:hypothetical protein